MTNWQIIKATSPEHLSKLSAHGGWCTKNYETAANYLSHGEAWALKKAGKRRPSYLLFSSTTGRYEFKRSGNKHVDPDKFVEENPSLSDFIKSALPDNYKEKSKGQDAVTHMAMNEDGTATITMADGTSVSICLDPVKTISDFQIRETALQCFEGI